MMNEQKSNMDKRSNDIIESIVRDTKFYETRYNCSRLEAFKDVVSDEPVFTRHAELASVILGLTIEPSWFARHTLDSREEVNQYYTETYEY